MKKTHILVLTVTLSCLMVSQVAADPGMGAIVIREDGQELWWGGAWDGADIFFLESNGLNGLEAFLCGDLPEGEILPYHDFFVIRPDGSVKFQEKASVYVRVYSPATPEDFEADPCGFLESGPQVAEGIATYVTTDNDWNIDHGGRNVWGWSEGGALYDLTGLCPTEIVHFKLVRKFQIDPVGADFPACWPDCLVTRAAKGPSLSCKKF